MASTKADLEGLNLSQDEVTRFTKAFQNEEFRKMFKEYAEEIADPENRRRYEEEIQTLENERGMDVKFVNPEPGYVVKTTVNGDTKAFINICKNDHIEKPSSQKKSGPNGKQGLSWSIPHSFAPPRDDFDKHSNKCKVYDVVIHPDTYRMAETNVRFKKMIHDTAFDGIERQFEVTIDRKNIKFPKIKFKGTPTATVIRTRTESTTTKESNPDDIMNSFPYPYDNKTTDEKSKQKEEEIKKHTVTKKEEKLENPDDEFASPKYSIKHRSDLDFQNFRDAPDARPSTRPNDLVIDIALPLIKSAAQVDLDIFEKTLELKSVKPAKYKLHLKLPYPVDENQGSAKFDKHTKTLTVTLPVIPAPAVTPEFSFESKENGEPDTSEVKHLCNGSSHEESKPLIEVLSSETAFDVELKPVEISTTLPEQSNVAKQSEHINYTSIDFDYSQDDETVSLVLHAIKVDRQTVSLSFANSSSVLIQMTSVGSGGFPIHYSLTVRFPEACTLETENCRADVSVQNVVIILVKTDASIGFWNKFEAGLDEYHLQEKLFLTRSSLAARLTELECTDDGVPLDRESTPELEVTEMDSDKLVVSIKEQNGAGRKKHLSESAEDIEIVFNHEVAHVKGIMKQHSRTTSESSDDIYSCSYGRQSSTASFEFNGSDSSPGDSDDTKSQTTTRKKTVSFSESVDETTYKVNQSVISMKSVLKNKRKKQRKAARKHTDKEARRQRKNSGSEYASSDDGSYDKSDLEHGSSENICVIDDDASTEPDSRDRDLSIEPDSLDGDDEASPTVDKAAWKDSARDGGDTVTSATGRDENGAPVVSSAEMSPDTSEPARESTKKPTEAVNIPCATERTGRLTDGSDSDDTADGEENRSAKVPLIEELDPQNTRNREGVTEGKQEESKSTSLSWADGKNSQEHGTQCAFDFSNSVMFDLDVD